MDYLWTPWRYSYVTQAEGDRRKGVPAELRDWPEDRGCVFCNIIASMDYAIGRGMPRLDAERAAGVVFRGERVYVCLNRFPYTSGHLMVVPYVHEASLAALPVETAQELILVAQRAERVLNAVYRPDGLNLGLNLGRSAGAGVAEHLHLHALPRWTGDTNFMTVTGETRVLPEDLGVTWERVAKAFQLIDESAG